jgi:histidinol dehydrogenase
MTGAAALKDQARGTLRLTGTLASLSAADRRLLLDRAPLADSEIAARTAAIIRDVRARGDDALRHLARRFDGVELGSLEIPKEARRRALDAIDPALRRAMARSADNIARVSRAWLPAAVEVTPEPGVTIGRRPDPLDCIGVYAPGGRAAYPSSVLMGAVPARIAGCGEIVLCSPPGESGMPPTAVLAAAELAGVDRVFAIGGAGAVAAMAFGTESIPRVDKIVGPGNAYVTEAKRQLVGMVGIDLPAGPSELLVIADGSTRAETVAAELLAQAEHDPLACVVAVCVGGDVAARVVDAIERQVGGMRRGAIAAAALRSQGAVLTVDRLDEAIAFANDYAPEHLWIAVADADAVVASVRRAGTIFIGECASVVFGDYITGANHVLPTGGAARAWSGLSVADFTRWTTWQRIDRDAASRLSADAARFAEAEGLFGHASAARQWELPV